MIPHINEMLKRVQHDRERFPWFVIPNQVLNWIQDLSISGSRFLVFRVLKPRPYMLNYPKILVVEKRERELPRPCHPMTSHRPTPLPPHSLNWMINRMLLNQTTHIRPSTESDIASAPVWTHLKAQYLCEEVRS